MRSTAFSPTASDKALIPGCCDPDISREELRAVQGWLRGYQVTVGDWMRGFRIPQYGTLSSLVREGADLYRRVNGGTLLAPKYFEKVVFDEGFSRQNGTVTSINLCTKPLDGSGRSLPQARSSFAANGRKIASTPEVVAGFVAYSVASLVPELDRTIARQELELQGKAPSPREPSHREFAQGFAPSCVFRSSSKTFAYNSMVGLHPHDLSPEKSDPNLYVVEWR